MGNYASYLLYAAVIIWILYRQLAPRPVKEKPTLYLILMLIGLVETVGAINANKIQLTPQWVGILAVSLIVLTAGFGALRALTCRVWADKGVKMRRGTPLTLVLWIITIGAHIYLGTLVKGSDTTMLLSLGLSLFIQQMIVIRRANKLAPANTPEDA